VALRDTEKIIAEASATLVIGHGASDIEPEAAAELTERYNERSPVKIRLRTRDEVALFFDGLVGHVDIARKP
jgi:hypothetical protein